MHAHKTFGGGVCAIANSTPTLRSDEQVNELTNGPKTTSAYNTNSNIIIVFKYWQLSARNMFYWSPLLVCFFFFCYCQFWIGIFSSFFVGSSIILLMIPICQFYESRIRSRLFFTLDELIQTLWVLLMSPTSCLFYLTEFMLYTQHTTHVLFLALVASYRYWIRLFLI